jgi:ACS family hexuronate transporter-like MFS transporter
MKIPKLRWVIAALLFLATAINYADRLALSVVSPDLRAEFHMTEQDYSYVLVAFFIAYAIMYAGSGYLVDRLGTRVGFAAFIFTWSVAAMLHGVVRGIWSLAAARFLLGLGEPGNWPAATKASAEWFPPEQRALVIGIFNAGSSLGSALAPPAAAFLTIAFGWRAAFVAIGATGIVWMALWLLIYQPPHANRFLSREEYLEIKDHVQPPEETAPASASKANWRKIIRMRECYTILLGRFLIDPVIYFIIFWLPEYLRKERHFDLAMVGKYAWMPFIFGGIGYTAGGWLCGWLIRRGWSIPKARRVMMAAGAAFLPVAILAPRVPAAWMAIAATCFATFGHGIFTPNIQALPTDLFPGQEVGTAAGLSGMGGAIGGILANLGTGWLVTHFSYSPVFLMAGLLHPLAAVLVWVMLPDRYFRNAPSGVPV